ncbi:MAG TPA: M56 family metallopeptidase [Allosphingosinicella sp.]|nr:M56 family metallopeptidase [Allosphingosinicella sp.]
MSIEFLAEMAWKSALISAGALAIAALLKSRSPNERAAVLRTAIALILMLPVLTWLLPALEIVTSAAPEPAAPAAFTPEMLAALAAAPAAEVALVVQDDPTPLILFAWLGGIAMVGFRLLAGLWTLRRWTRTASEVECPRWRETFETLGGDAPAARGVRLLVGDVPSPLGWGWLNPVILIDRDTIRDPGEAEAVLAHELAHVERRDWLVMILARIAVAIFWFNPLMWLLERHLVDEGEQAADARALARVEPARYAQTLLSCARHYPGLPATAIADNGLARRVKAVLEGKVREGAGSRRRAWAAVLLCILFAAPVAALKPVAAAPEAPDAPAAPVAPAALGAPPAPAAPPASMPGMAPPAPAAPSAASALPAPLAMLAGVPAAPPFPAAAPLPPAPRAPFALAMLHPAPPPPPAPRYDSDDDDDHDYDADADVDVDVDDVVDSAEIDREVREAMADAQRDLAEAGRETARAVAQVRVQALTAGRDARRVAAHAREAAHRGMVAGSAGMAQGARGMEQGARGMEAEADRLRSPAYRAEQIARAARRGENVTDRELVELIPKLRQGAEGLRRGAENMRRQAERMREDRH